MNRRGDTHADGTQIGKQCPHCTDITETHIHALVECSLNKELAAKLTFNINLEIKKTTSTLRRRGKEDASTLEAHLEGTRTQTYKIRKGWSIKYTDKHGRETITEQGPRNNACVPCVAGEPCVAGCVPCVVVFMSRDGACVSCDVDCVQCDGV